MKNLTTGIAKSGPSGPSGPIGSCGPMPPIRISSELKQAILSGLSCGIAVRFMLEPDDKKADELLEVYEEITTEAKDPS